MFAFVSLVAASSAFAQEPAFQYGKAEEVKEVKGVEWVATSEFGLVMTTGNSETTTVTGAAKASRKAGNNKLSLELFGTYAQSGVRQFVDGDGDGKLSSLNEVTTLTTVSARNLTGKARYDRYLTANNSLYVSAIGYTDKPAGKQFVGSGQVGYSRQMYKTEKHEAVAELGYDYSYTDFVTGKSVSIHSARAFLGYKGAMAEGTSFDASLEVLPNLVKVELPTGPADPLEDTRANAKASITSKLTKSLSINTGLEFRYDPRPAPLTLANVTLADGFVPESSKLDSVLKASLIYSFF